MKKLGRSIQPATAGEWRAWLQEHHAVEDDVWLVFYKKHTGKPSVTFEEATEEALCFGWIDSAMRPIDDETYALRYTPRRKGSSWSAVNKKRAARLIEQGRMTEAGFAKLFESKRFAHTVVLVEGVSDKRALQALADRRGRDLLAEGIFVVPMGGSKNIRSFLNLFGPQGLHVKLAGLCDAAEERDFQRGLDRAGLGAELTRVEMESLGFFVCVPDLEGELIGALGAATVEQIVEAQGELGSFRTLQKQPAQQGKTVEEQLRRFMGTRKGRKLKYATLLVDALDLTHVPRPLDRVLSHG